MSNLEELKKKIEEIESEMASVDFWNYKDKAQAKIKEVQTLKDELEGAGKYDRGGAVMTIFSGAGGADSEDFSRIKIEEVIDGRNSYVRENGIEGKISSPSKVDRFEEVYQSIFAHMKK